MSTVHPARVQVRCDHLPRADRRLFARFLARALAGYADGRNEPADDHTSHMSAYLHFDHVSPVDLALQVRAAGPATQDDADVYLDELIVRRELAINY